MLSFDIKHHISKTVEAKCLLTLVFVPVTLKSPFKLKNHSNMMNMQSIFQHKKLEKMVL